MGTNYYLAPKKPYCSHCNQIKPTLHIGKSSYGWAFALHVIPEKGIMDLNNWIECFGSSHAILNEYDEEYTSQELLHIITERTYQERAIIDGIYCIGHGSGSWDLIIGEFS